MHTHILPQQWPAMEGVNLRIRELVNNNKTPTPSPTTTTHMIIRHTLLKYPILALHRSLICNHESVDDEDHRQPD